MNDGLPRTTSPGQSRRSMALLSRAARVFDVERSRIPKNLGRCGDRESGRPRPNSWEFGYACPKCSTSKTRGGGPVLRGCLILVLFAAGCQQAANEPAEATPGDSPVTKLGSIEVTARLVEVPEGAIFKRELYDYATILKFEVLATHRGETHASTILVGQYNPFKPRDQAADRRVKGIGGTAQKFTAGRIYRMALESPLDDHFMGGIVNKYFGQDTGPLYWAVWTDAAD